MNAQMATFGVTGKRRWGRAAMRGLTALVIVLLLCLGTRSPSFAEPPGGPPPGMTQQQFDALVDAIAKSVAAKLKSDEKPAPASAQAPPASAVHLGAAWSLSGTPDSFSLLFDQAKSVVAAIPSVIGELRRIYGLLNRESSGGLSAGGFLSYLLVVAVLAVGCEVVIRRLMRPLQQRLAADTDPRIGTRSLVPLLALAIMDAFAVSMV